jgi:hypothetical protein
MTVQDPKLMHGFGGLAIQKGEMSFDDKFTASCIELDAGHLRRRPNLELDEVKKLCLVVDIRGLDFALTFAQSFFGRRPGVLFSRGSGRTAGESRFSTFKPSIPRKLRLAPRARIATASSFNVEDPRSGSRKQNDKAERWVTRKRLAPLVFSTLDRP